MKDHKGETGELGPDGFLYRLDGIDREPVQTADGTLVYGHVPTDQTCVNLIRRVHLPSPDKFVKIDTHIETILDRYHLAFELTLTDSDYEDYFIDAVRYRLHKSFDTFIKTIVYVKNRKERNQ